jgi:putative serine protease PepD
VTDEQGRGGARLEDVPADSAAGRAGLREGDVVVAVEGEAVAGVDELVLALRRRGVGESTGVTYLRDGREVTVQVVLMDRRV